MTQSVQAGIGMRLDLFAYLADLLLQHPGAKRLCRILRAGENVLALRLFQKPLEDFLHFSTNHSHFPQSCVPGNNYLKPFIDGSVAADRSEFRKTSQSGVTPDEMHRRSILRERHR